MLRLCVTSSRMLLVTVAVQARYGTPEGTSALISCRRPYAGRKSLHLHEITCEMKDARIRIHAWPKINPLIQLGQPFNSNILFIHVYIIILNKHEILVHMHTQTALTISKHNEPHPQQQRQFYQI